MDLNLSGKTALVTASSGGIGRGVAEALAGAGVRVAISGRTRASLERTERADPKAEIAGRQALFVVNLAPRKMAGQVSQAMLFDIGYADGITPVLALPEWAVPNGARAG